MKLFGTSGIRGVVLQELTPEFCLELGKAIGSNLKEGSTVAIATDTRVSRDMVKSSLISGLLATNVNAVDLGIIPTPTLAFLTEHFGYESGIMVTASHNPPDFNGIKLWKKNGMAYNEEDERSVEITFSKKTYRIKSWKEVGTFKTNINAKNVYIEDVLKKIKLKKKFRILVDPGNGASANFASVIFERAGLEVISINNEPNGLFPNRDPEPKNETLGNTISRLKEVDADIAICFDGDADRVVFCDKEGFIGYNEAIAFISRLKISKSGKKKVVTTVETGRLLDLSIEDLGGTVVRGKVGDAHVARVVKEEEASIGVEAVGHYIIPEMGYYPDTIYPSLFLLSNIQSVDEIRDFFNTLRPLYYSKDGIAVGDDLKNDMMAIIQKKHLTRFDAEKINTLDGFRLEFEDSWVLIRPSGTQPLIRVIVESEDKRTLEELMGMGIEVVNLAKEEVSK